MPASPGCGSFATSDERELGLPEGRPYEVPLLLADRNFDVGPDGRLNGELLHKTDPQVMECFSPFTVVNGAIWPWSRSNRPPIAFGC